MTTPPDHEALKAGIKENLGWYKNGILTKSEAAQSILQLIRSSLPKKFESIEEDGTVDKYVHNQKKDWYNQALDTMDKLLGGGNEQGL